MTNRTALFVRKQPGGVFAVEDTSRSTGARWYVCSGTGTDSTGRGRNPDAPLATWDYAVGLATADKHDQIFLMPGHAETITATNTLTLDQAGIETIGLGVGADRPTITIATDAAATVTISAASNKIQNVLFICGLDGLNSGITASGADVEFEDCEFRDATNVEADIWIAASGNRLTVKNCFFNGYTSGDQQEAMIDLAAVTGAQIVNSRFLGKVITACVNISTASYNVVVDRCVFYRATTTDLSLDVVDTATGSTWAVVECYDLGAGKSLSGGSGASGVAGDDIGAVSTGVSTVNSIVTTISTGVSVVNSIATKTSAGVSTNTSMLTTVSGGVSTVSSIVTTVSAAATGASTGVSTVSSIVTTASAGISTNSSIVTTISAGVSANTSRLTAESTLLNTISTAVSSNSSIVTTISAGVSGNTSVLTALSTLLSTMMSKITSGW